MRLANYFQDLFSEIEDFFKGIDFIVLTINIFKIIIGIIIIYLISKVLLLLLNRVSVMSIKKCNERVMQRRKTLNILFRSLLTYAFYICSFIYVLTFFNISTSTLITGVGAIGLIVTFAFQDLIKDIVAGVFIILENSFDVDDIVSFGSTKGKVEDITLRSTVLVSTTGERFVFRNATLGTITNFSQIDSFLGKITVTYAINVDYKLAIAHLNKIMPEFENSNENIHSIKINGIIRTHLLGTDIEIAIKTKAAASYSVLLDARAFILDNNDNNTLKIIKVS